MDAEKLKDPDGFNLPQVETTGEHSVEEEKKIAPFSS